MKILLVSVDYKRHLVETYIFDFSPRRRYDHSRTTNRIATMLTKSAEARDIHT